VVSGQPQVPDALPLRRQPSVPNGYEARLLVAASVVPSSLILVTMMNEALSSSEMSVLTRATRRNIPYDAILHSHCRENLKSYVVLFALISSDLLGLTP
jgi:hypothetical protein